MNKEVICFFLVVFAFDGVLSHDPHGSTCSSSDQCDQSVGAQYCKIEGYSPGCSLGSCTCEGEGATTDYIAGKCRELRRSQGEPCVYSNSADQCATSTGLSCNTTTMTCECTNVNTGWQNGLCTGDSDKHALGELCPAGDKCVFPSSSNGLTMPWVCTTQQTCACPSSTELSGTVCVTRIVGIKGGSCVGNSDSPVGLSGGLCQYSYMQLNCSSGICDCLSPNGYYAATGSNSGMCRADVGTAKNGEYCTTTSDCVDGNVCTDCNGDTTRKICRTAGAPSNTAGTLFTLVISIATSVRFIS